MPIISYGSASEHITFDYKEKGENYGEFKETPHIVFNAQNSSIGGKARLSLDEAEEMCNAVLTEIAAQRELIAARPAEEPVPAGADF